MWSFVIFVFIIGSCAEAQNSRTSSSQDHINSHGWDIRLAVPGEPVKDYPTLNSIPRTTFSCAGKEPGYYADLETGCQVFRVCTVGSTYGFQSFLCPNGTLFNQDVFVCDWWMHVKCQPSQRITNAQSARFANLRLGPQLMKDIKKMLTYPMRNPYDKTSMKSNLIVMQEYRPPAGQLFPNGALIAGPEKPPNNIYVPAKQIQQNLIQGYPNDVDFAASTPDTRYVPAPFTNQQANNGVEFTQRQNLINEQNVLTTQHSQIGNLISNGHAAQYSQNYALPLTQNPHQANTPYNVKNTNKEQISSIQQPKQQQNFYRPNSQYTQTRTNDQINYKQQIRQNQNINQVQYTQSQKSTHLGTPTVNAQGSQRGQLGRARAQYTDSKKSSRVKNGNINGKAPYTKPQNNNEDKQPYTYRPPIPPLPEELNVLNTSGFKQNLVSSDIPPTVITKTLTYSKLLQEPKPGRPKSRVTVKTWIVKPKSARLVAEPTSYVYKRPTVSPTERIVVEKSSTPYVYNRPTIPSQSERVIKEENPTPYNYNSPTTSIPKSQRVVEDLSSDPQSYVYNRPTSTITTTLPEKLEDDEPEPYVYNRPTVTSRQIITTNREPFIAYLPPTSKPRPTEAAQLNLPTSTTSAPITFQPAARLYLPPEIPQNLARQYLAPNSTQPASYQNAQLQVAPTSPTNLHEVPNENPSYTVVKQSRINASRNNLTFTDILTKEKLDITVNDIVKDTGKILQTASPPKFGQYRDDDRSEDYPNDSYLPAEFDESGEKLTSQIPTAIAPSSSARLIAQPARSLEPPPETPTNKNSNPISNLPFYKETSVPNTIERTVSLKITIPERLASYILAGGNETDFDRLEILNTGSSNYLVISNQNIGNASPISNVLSNKNSNVSTSQALVFSLLADSLNAAKEYSNIVKQDVLTPATSTPAPHAQNFNNEDFSQISNKISQLTSAQYSNDNNKFNSVNLPSQSTTTQKSQSKGSNGKSVKQLQQTQAAQYKLAPTTQNQNQISAQYSINNNILHSNLLDINPNQIYSGQLYQFPVPEVTSQIYNRPQSSDLVETKHKQNTQTENLPQINHPNNVANHKMEKQSSAEFEIIQSQTSQANPAKLQVDPSNEPASFYSDENFNSLLNSDNSISAQLQDKIVGTIPHPLEDNKLLTYEKDHSYYLFTKLDNNGQNIPINVVTKANNIPSVITFQLVPSLSYQLDDEKEQQKFLNQFQIDEFGAPRGIMRGNIVQSSNQQRGSLISSVDYSVDHPTSAKQVRLEPITALYKGPSSYSAPQGSVGNLPRQILLPNYSSRLENFNDNSEGYPKRTPARRFVF